MIFHKNWIINCVLSAATLATCLIGDKLLAKINSFHLFRALADNLAHGLIGMLSLGIIVAEHKENIYLACVCFILSSLIDVDHFIAAKSLKLSVSAFTRFFIQAFIKNLFF